MFPKGQVRGMTLGKNTCRALAIAICFIFIISVVSCNNNADNFALEQLKNMQSMQTTQVEETEPAIDNVQKYRIVISAGASDEVLDKALELSSAVTGKTGKTCTVVRDTDSVIANDDTMEIQLGYVDRQEAREAMGRLKRDDYLCAKFSDAVVLGGKVESADVSAVDKFISEVLPRAEGKTIINDDDGFNVSASYELSEIMLCGIGLGNYGIVCDAQASGVAETFRELLADKCGAYSDISNKPHDDIREIIFKLSDSEQVGYCSIYRQNEDVLVESDSIYGLSVAVCKLYDIALGSVKDGIGYINISSPLFYSCEAGDLSVMSVVIDEDNVSELGSVLSLIDISSVDVMTVGAVTGEAWMVSKAHIPANYSYELYTLEDNKYFPIIYNTESFDSLHIAVDETPDSLCLSVGDGENEVRWVTVYEKKADNRQANVDTVLDNVSAFSHGLIATYIGALGCNSDFCVTHEGSAVVYFSCIGDGDKERNALAVVTDKIMDCEEIYGKMIGEGDAFCIFATVSNIYCPEYLDLAI